MRKLFSRPRAWYGASAIFLIAALAACSAMPVTQGTLEEVQADQAAAAEAADSGNLLRTLLFSGSALLGSIGVAVQRIRAKDNAPFAGKVGSREVSFTEDELARVVEAARTEGKIPS